MPYSVERNQRKNTQATEGETKIPRLRVLCSVPCVVRRMTDDSQADGALSVPYVEIPHLLLAAWGNTERSSLFTLVGKYRDVHRVFRGAGASAY